MAQPVIAIAGASGVIGAAAVEQFARAGWNVIAISRRRPFVPADVTFRHVPVDLRDGQACRDALADAGPITHLVFAAVSEEPGLVAGWIDPARMDENLRMFANLAEPLAQSGHLQWVGLLQGTKAYGAHLHSVMIPAREDRPRDDHANFYWLQEDCLRALAKHHRFGWTIFRPQVLFGGAPGAVMNPVAAIGAYAALCRELELPFACPGQTRLLWEVADASLLAETFLWAAGERKASGQTYNITNGDIFVLRDAWGDLGALLGLETEGTVDEGLVGFFARPGMAEAWTMLAAKHDLAVADISAMLGESHHYVDLLVDDRVTANGNLPALVSTIKIRKAGFAACRDSFDSLTSWLRRMCELKLLPPNLFA